MNTPFVRGLRGLALLGSLVLVACAAPPPAPSTPTPAAAAAVPAAGSSTGSSARPAPAPSAAARPAYQLQACKSVAGWQIREGRCDGVGAFEGRGVASRLGVTFIGGFVAGVPQGPGTMCLRSSSQWPPMRPENGPCGGDMACSVSFSAGKLGGQVMQCEGDGGRDINGVPQARTRIKIDSPAGFFLADGVDADVGARKIARAVSTDQATVEIDGRVAYRPLAIGSSRIAGRAVGEVRELRMADNGISFDRFKGSLTVPTANVRHVKTGELQVSGTFKGEWAGSQLNFWPYPFAVTSSGAIQREGLVQLRYGNLSYDLVFQIDTVFKGLDAGRVLYYKDNAGVEFDGTDPVCLAKTKRMGSAELAVQRNAGSGQFEGYRLTPVCGRITTPTGSFAGMFRDGKPQE